MKKWLKKIFLLFVFWRAGLSLLAMIAERLLVKRPDFFGPNFWSNFDGVHYLSIAERGYFQYEQAFFPFYPLLIRWLTFFTRNYVFSGLFISHLAFFASLVFLYLLVKLDFSEKIAWRSLVYLLIFPTSFYFASVYSESLFLALVLGSFYAARKKRWWLAGILGGLASATRLTGIFLLPALFYERQEAKRKSFAALLLIPLGLLAYMWYLKQTAEDPFYFIHVQPFFGAERSGGKIVLLYQVFWRYLKMLVTVQKWTLTYFVVVLEALIASGFLAILILAYRQGLRHSYLIFAVLAYLIPTLTGTFSSLPRYVLACFPCFLYLGLVKDRRLHKLLPLFFLGLLVICIVLFSRGYWVA